MQPITVIAIGPDDPSLLTLQAADALRAASPLLLRTGQHGVSAWLDANAIPYQTLDAVYEGADDFDMLNDQAAEAILLAAEGNQAFAYAVPDPLSDTTVTALVMRNVPLRVLAGVTQVDTTRTQALGAGLSSAGGVLTMPATDLLAMRELNPAMPLLITELSSRLTAGEVKLKLLDVYLPETSVLIAGSLVRLDEIDRERKINHLSSVYIPGAPMTTRTRYTFGDLLDVMARLRRPGDGCPWDLEQTHETLRQYVIEEAYELVDAIDQGDPDRVSDELGDVLLQVVFHAQVAKEHGTFDITDVTTAICRKMITRHAHIFGDIVCETPEDVLRSWEAIKQKEKGLKATTDVMRDVPGHLPALMRAYKVQNKARQVGFDWDTPQEALAKVREEADEVDAELAGGTDPEGELGDLLFAVVNASRLAGVQPEVALGGAIEKFIRRFSQMEQAVARDGKSLKGMTLSEMDAYWDAVKQTERST